MNRSIRSAAVLPVAMLVFAGPLAAQGRADAVLAVTDDGALEAPAVHAIRNVTASELRKRGVLVAEDRGAQDGEPADESLAAFADAIGARRVFAIRIGGRLGQKIPLSLDELSPDTLQPVYSASLTATGLEECDVVAARLVDAVLDRRSAEDNAEMTTVTAKESQPFAKKPGERFWFIGLPVAIYDSGSTPVGLSLGYGYEAENFRISATGAGYARGGDGVGYVALEGAWIPFATEISPFVGGGLGYMGAGGRGGLGGIVEAGLEAFRLHGVRALAGVQVTIPFFEVSQPAPTIQSRAVYPAAFVRLAF